MHMWPIQTSPWLMRSAFLILFSIATSSAVAAQSPEGAAADLETTLIPGMTVWITDTSGSEEKTRIVAVSAQAVTAARGDRMRHFRASDVKRVRERRSDSLLDGALIGAGAAVASGLFVCTRMEPWETCRDDVGPMLRIGALGAGIGAGIDALIRGRRTIYEAEEGSWRLQAAPIVARHARGLQVSVSF